MLEFFMVILSICVLGVTLWIVAPGSIHFDIDKLKRISSVVRNQAVAGINGMQARPSAETSLDNLDETASNYLKQFNHFYAVSFIHWSQIICRRRGCLDLSQGEISKPSGL